MVTLCLGKATNIKSTEGCGSRVNSGRQQVILLGNEGNDRKEMAADLVSWLLWTVGWSCCKTLSLNTKAETNMTRCTKRRWQKTKRLLHWRIKTHTMHMCSKDKRQTMVRMFLQAVTLPNHDHKDWDPFDKSCGRRERRADYRIMFQSTEAESLQLDWNITLVSPSLPLITQLLILYPKRHRQWRFSGWMFDFL